VSEEVYECAGCAGEISAVEAVWLPEVPWRQKVVEQPRPYCCAECLAVNPYTCGWDGGMEVTP